MAYHGSGHGDTSSTVCASSSYQVALKALREVFGLGYDVRNIDHGFGLEVFANDRVYSNADHKGVPGGDGPPTFIAFFRRKPRGPEHYALEYADRLLPKARKPFEQILAEVNRN